MSSLEIRLPEYGIDQSDIATIYSRYISLGFTDKFTRLLEIVPLFKVHIWFQSVSFNPFLDDLRGV